MKSQRGMALITVMILVIVVLGVLASLFYRHGVEVSLLSKTLHGEQAALLALSGESWAIEQLKQDGKDSLDVDSLHENWAQALPPLAVEGGSISGQLMDLQSRFNLNQLDQVTDDNFQQWNQVGSLSPLGLLLRLAEQQQIILTSSQLAALADWQDSDDNLLPGGAEANDYLLQDPPYRSANSEFSSVEELSAVIGFEDGVALNALKPWLAAIPKDARQINVNTAPVALIQALSPQFDTLLAEQLVEQRDQSAWHSTEEFYQDVADLSGLVSLDAARILVESGEFKPISVNSRYFLLSIYVQIGVNTLELQSVIRRNSSSSVEVLARSLHFLPIISGN